MIFTAAPRGAEAKEPPRHRYGQEVTILYYITHRGTGTRLYRSRRDAALLLTRYKTELEAGGQILIDYLLLPTSLEALIFCPFPIKEGSEVLHHLVLDLWHTWPAWAVSGRSPAPGSCTTGAGLRRTRQERVRAAALPALRDHRCKERLSDGPRRSGAVTPRWSTRSPPRCRG